MINILHLINYMGGGGTESYIYSLAKKLHNNKCRFFIAYSKPGPALKLFQDMEIQTIQLNMSSPYDIKAARKLKQLCKKLSIDVVHTHFLRENYISIFSKIMGNKAVLINTNHMLTENSRTVVLSNKLMTFFNSHIIAVSNAVKEKLVKEGINPKKIKLIYNGIDTEYWNCEKNLGLKDEFGIDKQEFVVASVARFSEEKGHFFLLETIALLKKLIKTQQYEGFQIKFLLIGDGGLLSQCKDLSKSLGIAEDVIFTGHRSDVKNILPNCDLFVSHSKSEALGISILEALSCGLPVITTDSGGTREIINKDTDCGIMVDYGDKENFAKAIIKLFQDKALCEKYKRNGYNILKEKFNLDKTAEETYTLYSFRIINRW